MVADPVRSGECSEPVKLLRRLFMKENPAEKPLVAARHALADVLRTMHANRILDPAARGQIENAFEDTKNLLAQCKADRAQLLKAAAALELGVQLLSNHTLKFPADLVAAKSALHAATKAAEMLITE